MSGLMAIMMEPGRPGLDWDLARMASAMSRDGGITLSTAWRSWVLALATLGQRGIALAAPADGPLLAPELTVRIFIERDLE